MTPGLPRAPSAREAPSVLRAAAGRASVVNDSFTSSGARNESFTAFGAGTSVEKPALASRPARAQDEPVLTDSTITTMLPVTDGERAGRFYSRTLGLKPTGAAEDGTRYFAAGAGIIGLRPMPDGAQRENTALSFEVVDIQAEVAALESRGVRFQDYDVDGLKTVDHIADLGTERAAWFTDSEGNVLCLHQVLG